MNYECILLETDGAIATVTLNRPDVLNSMNWQMRFDLEHALDALNEDPAVKVVILRGAGRAFCAGAYVKGQTAVQALGFFSRHTYLHQLFYKFTRFRKPIIGSLHGYCLGMGLEFALLCDLLIASDETKFGEPEINLGESYGFVRLPRLVGEKRAMWISLSGEMFSAQEAKDWGIVNKVVPRDQLEPETRKLAERLSRQSASAMWILKEGMKASLSMDPQNAVVFESMAEALSQTSSDYREGVSAFFEKREPRFDEPLPGTRFENTGDPGKK